MVSGAISRSRPTGQALLRGPDASRIDRGEDAWVEALCEFYERDCLPQKAWNIRHGAPLDYLDLRAIEALKAAFKRIAA
jgi:hypothetical protein